MSDPKTLEQIRRLKALFRIAYSALDDIYRGRGDDLPEMKAALALDTLDALKLSEDRLWEDDLHNSDRLYKDCSSTHEEDES